jgi:hypothetical protein
MTNPRNITALRGLDPGLAAVAARLEPNDAARAASALSQAMTKPGAPFALGQLAQGLAAVAARLEPKEAAQHCALAASTLTLAMSKTADPAALRQLVQGLSAVAARLGPKEAAQYSARAASALARAMTEPGNSTAQLAEGLSAVAARLEPNDAARAASALSQALTKTNNSVFARGELAQGLSAVAARLEPKEAASTLTQAMTKTNGPADLRELAQGLLATLTRDPRNSLVRAASLEAVAGVSYRHPLLAPTALVLTLEPLPCRLSTQELVDLLKSPFCVDPARRVVLGQLERRYRRQFADHWEFVRFATEQRLGLDFTTPPRRPEGVLPEARQ